MFLTFKKYGKHLFSTILAYIARQSALILSIHNGLKYPLLLKPSN